MDQLPIEGTALEHFEDQEVPLLNNEQYRVRVEAYNGQQVSLFEIGGREYLTAEDIGLCLGMAEPRKSVNKIYNRNRDELDPHTIVVKMTTNSPGNPNTRLFTETGANLIAVFSRTPEAKEFRLWLARLPKQVRQFKEALPEALEEAERRGAKRGAAQALALMESSSAARLGTQGLSKLIWYRLQGLTQQETATLLNLSVAGVQEMERPLKETIVFKAVRDAQRHWNVRLALAEALAETEKSQLPNHGGNQP